MKDQVSRWTNLGIKSAAVTRDMSAEDKQSLVLLLTATVTQDMVTEILNLLRLEPPPVTMLTYLPDRPNVFLDVQRTKDEDITKAAEWLVPHLRQGKNAGKVIVYCGLTISGVTNVYHNIMAKLGNAAWVSDEHTVHTRIVEMFHSHLYCNSQKRTLDAFVEMETNVRCVVATVAFGLAVQVPDVRCILHWGPASDILSY
ncbi:hypothetical protein ABVT39_002763 [Epinephelus coioides]